MKASSVYEMQWPKLTWLRVACNAILPRVLWRRYYAATCLRNVLLVFLGSY